MATNKIANRDASEYTTERTAFEGNNLYARNEGDLYVVYSYRDNYPIFIYDSQTGVWIENETKYSPTTSKHVTQSRPDAEDIHRLPLDEINNVLSSGGYVPYCANRCATWDTFLST